MKLIEKVRRHASIAGGNFARLFAGEQIPPLPAAVSRLIRELGADEPDLHRISELITATPEIAAKVLQTVNSAYFGLPKPVSSLMRAVTMLGLRQVRPLILSFTMRKTLALPDDALFDGQGFWSDALLKALLARALAEHYCREEREEAFTAMLLADIALPVLLTTWAEYYQPVVQQWQADDGRLSHLEQASFRWDHAQAGAWILQNWEFPAELVCLVGLHNADPEKLRQIGLEDSAALPLTVAALAPSSMHPSIERAQQTIDAATSRLSLDASLLDATLARIREEFGEICGVFDLAPAPGLAVLDLLRQVLGAQGMECVS